MSVVCDGAQHGTRWKGRHEPTLYLQIVLNEQRVDGFHASMTSTYTMQIILDKYICFLVCFKSHLNSYSNPFLRMKLLREVNKKGVQPLPYCCHAELIGPQSSTDAPTVIISRHVETQNMAQRDTVIYYSLFWLVCLKCRLCASLLNCHYYTRNHFICIV